MAEHWSPKPGAVGSNPTGPAIFVIWLCILASRSIYNAMFKKLINFFREVRQEMKKVTWPTRREISGSTSVVIVSVLIVSIYLGIIDTVLQWVMMKIHY